MATGENIDMTIPKVYIAGDYTNPVEHSIKDFEIRLTEILNEVVSVEKFDEHYESFDYEELARFDCMIMFTNHWEDKTQTVPELLPLIISYVAMGGSVVFLHSLNPAYDREIAQMMGAQPKESPYETLVEYTFPNGIANKLPAGRTAKFSIDDELSPVVLSELGEIEVLMYAKSGGNKIPSAWRREFGMGRVVTITAGHEPLIYDIDEFNDFLKWCVLWAAKSSRQTKDLNFI